MAHSSAGRSVLSRHLQLLDSFTVDAPFLTVSELSRRSGLSLATVHRLSADLQENGLIERLPDRSYRLGVRLWELACRTPGALGVREIASPHLHELHEHVRQHTQLGILEGNDVVFLDRLSMRDAVVNVTLIGGRLPLHASSSGLVLLAYASMEVQDAFLASAHERFTPTTVTDASEIAALLRHVRANEFVVADGFIHPDVRGIAVPVRGAGDTVVAALSIVVPNDASPTLPLVERLRTTAARISKDLLVASGPSGRPAATVGSQYRRRINARSGTLSE